MLVELTQEQKDLVIKEWQEAQTKQVVKPKGRFIPKISQKYFYIDYVGNVVYTGYVPNSANDIHRLSIGNCYETKADAQLALKSQELLIKLKDEIAELNGDWVVGWGNIWEKYYLEFNHSSGSNGEFYKTSKAKQKVLPNGLYGVSQTMGTILSTWSKEDLYLALFGEQL